MLLRNFPGKHLATLSDTRQTQIRFGTKRIARIKNKEDRQTSNHYLSPQGDLVLDRISQSYDNFGLATGRCRAPMKMGSMVALGFLVAAAPAWTPDQRVRSQNRIRDEKGSGACGGAPSI